MARAPFLDSIVNFLRTGYPEGVPDVDYIPLFALLRRQLSSEEVGQVADDLAASGDPASAASIADAIRTATRDTPLDSDIARVSAHLAAGGWPLASPHDATGSR
jgi:Protein of unknown function (DUF3349)